MPPPPPAVHYEAALSLSPLHPDAWFALGFAYLRLDSHMQALRVCDCLAARLPAGLGVWWLDGWLYGCLAGCPSAWLPGYTLMPACVF